MNIVTASDSTFIEILNSTVPANERMGHKPVIYDVGGLGYGKPFQVQDEYMGWGRNRDPETPERLRFVGICPWKPAVILQALEDTNDDVLWLDADAWVIRPLELGDDFDVAVTMRRPHEWGRTEWPELYGFLNSGFVFIRNTILGRLFCKMWIEEIPLTKSKSDQNALNNIVRHSTDLREYNRVFLSREGIRIKVLKTDEYNWIYAPEEPLPTTKVLHFKKDIRDKLDIHEWCRRKF